MEQEKSEIVLEMEKYLQILLDSEIPICFFDEIFEVQEAKYLLMVILRKMDIQGADVINEVIQTQPYIDKDELQPDQLVLLNGIEDIYESIENHNMKISELKSNPKIQNTKIDDLTPSAPPSYDFATQPPTVNPKIVELQRNSNGFGINVRFPRGFKKKIKVKNVEEHSYAAKQNVKEGDKLKSIEIGGKDISKYSKSKILKKWKEADKIILKY